MARKPNEGWQRQQYAALMDLFRYAAEIGYLEGYLPQERKAPSLGWLERELPILVGVAQQTITLPMMTLGQAAAWMGMSIHTLRWHVFYAKDLKTFKPGGKMLLIKLEDLKKFKKDREA